MPADGGMPSSDSAKDIRHLLKMQNIPSESEKEEGGGGDASDPYCKHGACLLYETFRQALYSPSHAKDFFSLSPLLLVFLTRSRDRVTYFCLECKFRFYSMNE